MPESALEGVSVLEIGGGVAGGYCGKLFADMGAHVRRIDPADGDPLDSRRLDPDAPETEGLYGRYLNAGKAMGLADGDAPFDLLILGEEADRSRTWPAPRLATLDITWFGHNGPYANWKGADLIVQALAGMSHPAGPAKGPPLFLGEHQATQLGGLAGYCAGMAALIGGAAAQPARYDISILESVIVTSELQICYSHFLDAPLGRRGVNRFVPTCPLSIHKCKEGWIGVTPLTPQQWQAMCEALSLPDMRDDPDLLPPRTRYPFADRIEAAFDPAFLTKTAEEWAAIGRQRKIPMAIVPDAEGILRHPIFNARGSLAEMTFEGGRYRTPLTPIRLEETPPKANLNDVAAAGPVDPLPAATDADGPLAGVRVLDFSMGWAGPLATRMLGDLGAEVIKVEAGRYPDWWRGVDWSEEAIARGQYEESLHFSVIARGKKSVSLDLTRPEGLDLAKRLASESDVVVENQAAGVMDRLGLGFDELSHDRDDLIMLSMSAFGGGNAWSDTRAYGSVLEQGSGLPSFCGEPDWPPTMAHIAYGDPVGGFYGGASLLTAIYRMRRVGRGQWINNTQIEAMLPFTSAPLLIRQATGREPVRRGARHSAFVPHGVFPAAGDDAWLAVALTSDAAWPALARAIGRDDWAADAALASAAMRRSIEAEIARTIAEWCRGRRADAAAATLQGAGVAAAAVASPGEVEADPQLRARGFFYTVDRPYVGRQLQASLPFLRNGARPPLRGPAPFLGGDSEAVLKELLGVADETYDDLLAMGVVSLRPTQLRGGAPT